jgi:glucokinase
MTPPRDTIFALDVGATKTIVAAFDGLPGTAAQPLRPPVRFATPRDPGAFLDAVVAAAADALPPDTRPAAIGMGVPGPLDPVRGIVEYSTNLGWRDLPLAPLVSARFGGVPTSMDDDGNTGALGEAIAGAGKGADPYVYLTLGTGLGSGVVIGGRVVTGAHGAAGEVGHMAVGDREGPRCGCGGRNCVEAWCAGVGLARRARETWPGRRLPDGTPTPRDAAAVFRLARSGNDSAAALIGRAQHALAVAMAALLAAVDPAAMTVGGTIGVEEPRFVRGAFREATRLVHWSTGRRVELRPPMLGDASVVAGAAVLGARCLEGTPWGS